MMATDINMWAGCFEEAGKLTDNGNNDVDQNGVAHKLFSDSTNPPRNLLCEHGWRMITAYLKWRIRMRWGMSKKDRKAIDADGDPEDNGGSGKRIRLDADGDTFIASDSHVFGGITRPDDVKKSKAKRRGKGVTSEEVVNSFGELLQGNTEMRGRDHQLRQHKLDLDMTKEIRRQKQMEIEERNVQVEEEKVRVEKEKVQVEQLRMKYNLLQTLLSKESLTPIDERFKKNLQRELYGDN